MHCRQAAYDTLAGYVKRLRSADALLGGAVAIAMHEMPEADVAATAARVDAVAAQIRGRFRSDSQHAILAHAHAVLFDEMGLHYAVDEVDPLDSYLPAVIERSRGLPISLSLFYRLVLERLGVTAHGINTPGHFLIGVELGDSVMIVDAAARGRVVTMHEVVQLVTSTQSSSASMKEYTLPIASNRDWLMRILRNLIHVFGVRNRPTESAAMVELKQLLDDE